MTQPTLFPTQPLPAYQPGSATSRAAAVAAVAFRGTQRDRVYAALVQAGASGLTQREAARVTGIERPSLCLRFRELEQAGEIGKAGIVRDRCEVYRVR